MLAMTLSFLYISVVIFCKSAAIQDGFKRHGIALVERSSGTTPQAPPNTITSIGKFLDPASKKLKLVGTSFYLPREYYELETVSNFTRELLRSGSKFVKDYYSGFGALEEQNNELLRRCIENRAITFDAANDRTILRNLPSPIALYLPWDLIGTDLWEGTKGKSLTDQEKEQVLLVHLHWVQQFQTSRCFSVFVTTWNMIETFEKYKKEIIAEFKFKNYLSYDEMKLCSLLVVAGSTNFYDDGDRENRGGLGPERSTAKYIPKGYIMGAVGPRLEVVKYLKFETAAVVRELWLAQKLWQKQQSVVLEGKTYIWNVEIYEEPPEIYLDYLRKNRGVNTTVMERDLLLLNKDGKSESESMREIFFPKHVLAETKNEQWKTEYSSDFVDVGALSWRYHTSYKMYFEYIRTVMERLRRVGNRTHLKCYVAMTGLGAGFWAIKDDLQHNMIAGVIHNILTEYKDESNPLVEYIDTIDFAHWKGSGTPFNKSGDTFENIKIIFSKNSLASIKSCAKCIVFVLYPYDSNSWPGNEFWVYWAVNHRFGVDAVDKRSDILGASNDPAAAACSDIIFTQSAIINPYLSKTVKIIGDSGIEDWDLAQKETITAGDSPPPQTDSPPPGSAEEMIRFQGSIEIKIICAEGDLSKAIPGRRTLITEEFEESKGNYMFSQNLVIVSFTIVCTLFLSMFIHYYIYIK